MIPGTREVTDQQHYERYREQKLTATSSTSPPPPPDTARPFQVPHMNCLFYSIIITVIAHVSKIIYGYYAALDTHLKSDTTIQQ
jgi:hypothetical protein